MQRAWAARAFVGACAVVCAASASRAAAPIKIFTPETVYADLARQIGGKRVTVSSTFTSADIAILNGGGLDPRGPKAKAKRTFEPSVSAAAGIGPDAYFWFDIPAMKRLGDALTEQLKLDDPAGSSVYAQNVERFHAALAKVQSMIRDVAFNYRGSTVFVADQMPRRLVEALRFQIVDPEFLGKGPSPQDIRALRENIAERSASILLYNSQTNSPAIKGLVSLAQESGVPVVGIRETLPQTLSYQDWMAREINAIHGALNEAAP